MKHKLTLLDVATSAKRMALAAVSAALSELPDNKTAFTYTIVGFDKSPYITRTLLPRIGTRRLLLHKIHRPDYDQWMHNHPWRTATFRILSGGYVEERLAPDGSIVTTYLQAGDVNRLDCDTFHRIVSIEPGTWTLGLIGERMQSWGFLVDGREFVESGEYFRQSAHVVKFGGQS